MLTPSRTTTSPKLGPHQLFRALPPTGGCLACSSCALQIIARNGVDHSRTSDSSDQSTALPCPVVLPQRLQSCRALSSEWSVVTPLAPLPRTHTAATVPVRCGAFGYARASTKVDTASEISPPIACFHSTNFEKHSTAHFLLVHAACVRACSPIAQARVTATTMHPSTISACRFLASVFLVFRPSQTVALPSAPPSLWLPQAPIAALLASAKCARGVRHRLKLDSSGIAYPMAKTTPQSDASELGQPRRYA